MMCAILWAYGVRIKSDLVRFAICRFGNHRRPVHVNHSRAGVTHRCQAQPRHRWVQWQRKRMLLNSKSNGIYCCETLYFTVSYDTI